jgi:hypothetical protein
MNKTIMFALRLLCSLLLVFQAATVSVVAGQQPATTVGTAFMLEDGTPVKLRLSQTVSRSRAEETDGSRR